MCLLMEALINFRYFRAAPLPHAISLLSALIGMALAVMCGRAVTESPLGAIFLLGIPAAGWAGLALVCQADALSRYREYRRVKAIFQRRGFCTLTVKAMSRSRCQRDAAALAAAETGYGRPVAIFFRRLGYAWYHLLPDRILSNPALFFDPGFLRATFLPGKVWRSSGKET
jgi:hypothetical protein